MVENARASKVKKMSAGRAVSQSQRFTRGARSGAKTCGGSVVVGRGGGGTLPCLRELANMGGGFFFEVRMEMWKEE